jgi:hypothetical protein
MGAEIGTLWATALPVCIGSAALAGDLPGAGMRRVKGYGSNCNRNHLQAVSGG